MAANNPYAKYQQNSIMTSSPQELNLMLYNGSMKFIKKAIMHIEAKEIENAHISIVRAQNIILEFMSNVDRQYEVGEQLYQLYDYMDYSLREADFKKDIKMLEEVYNMIKDLKETWEEAMKKAKVKGK